MHIRKILVPVDFSDTASVALEYGIDLAKTMGAEINVFHAYQLPVYMLPDGGFLMTTPAAVDVSASAQKGLDTLLADHQADGVPIRTTLVEGTPADEIARYAQDHEVDLIVMGTHGRRGLSHALLGSVAERVVRTSMVPVLTVRAPAPV